ncbi:hypothetical protein EV177_010317, partial [Coemansia sp. RSA 1804]
ATVASRLDADTFDSSANNPTHATDAARPAPAYTPFAAAVHIHSPLLPPPHNLRHSADSAAAASASSSAADAAVGGALYLRQHDYARPAGQTRPHSSRLSQERTAAAHAA